MADLNQLTRAYKENNLPQIREKMLHLIKKYETPQYGRICCFFWRREAKDAEASDNLIVGCSRGCFSSNKELEELRMEYSEKLCKECVDEARIIAIN